MGKYRGLNLSGGLRANFRKIKVKKSIDEMEISDRGAITGTPSDLSTKGAGHRRNRGNNQSRGARGATRESVDYGFITGSGSNIIQEHDYGTVIENTTSLSSAAFETRRSLGFASSIAEEETAVATQITYPETVSLYNSTGIIPVGTPLILNTDGTVSAVTGTLAGPDIYGISGFTQSGSVLYTGNAHRVFRYNGDGTKVFTTMGNNTVSELSLSVAYDISTATWTPTQVSSTLSNISAGSIDGLDFSADGTTLIVCHQISSPDLNDITQYNLTTAFDISTITAHTAVLDTRVAAGVSIGGASAVLFGDDGNKLFALVNTPDLVMEYALSTPYDISSATFTTGFNFKTATGADNLLEMHFNSSGTKLLMTDNQNDSLYEIDLSTAWDISTATYNNNYIDFSSIDTIPQAMNYNNDESKLYVSGGQNKRVYTLTLTSEGGGAGTTNLTSNNYLGFAGSEFSYDGSLGQVISFGGTVDNFTGLTVGETYYVQNDGSISLVPSDVVAGTAVSTTAIQVQAPVVNYSYEGSTYTIGQSSGTFTGGAQSVAVTNDGNTVFQGFPYNMTPNEESGGLEIYTKDSGGNWSVLQSIAPPLEGASNSFKWRFGATVRVTEDGNRMVTMRTGGVSGYSPGKFYVYDKNETTGLYELTASHQHYSDAGMSNQRFDKSTGYNGLDMSPDGTLIMIHHMKYVNSSSGYENWAIVYRLDENGTYQYTDKIQMPISGSQGSMSGASQWSPVDMSTSGHLVWAHPTWNSFGKAAYAYYDLDTGNTYSGILNPGATVSAFGRDVAMAKDGSVCAVLDPQFPTGGVAPNKAGAVFIYKWDEQNKTYNFSERLTANSVSMPDAIEQATGIQFNQDGTQLYVKKSGNVAIFAPDENGNYILSQDLPNSFVTSYYGSFDFSTNMAYMICGGTTFGVHGGTSGSAGQSSGNLPTANSSTWYGDRMIASGGRTSSKYSSIEYIEIATGGNATAMGNMLEAKVFNSSISDSSNYYTIGGQTDAFGHSKLIEYKAFSSTANSSQYGDLTGFFAMGAAGSNGVTGIYAHQYGLLGSYLTGMDWFTLGGTSGNSSSLGDLSVGRSTGAGCADATYFVLGGGNYDGGPYAINTTEYLTIATGGTATAGGNLSYGAQANGAASNATKGIWAGGYSNASNSTVNSMSVMTLANPSNNATNFGNLTVAVQYPGLSCSSDKVIQAGGYGNSYVNTISSASIETGGTTSSIGTLSVARMGVGAATGNAS